MQDVVATWNDNVIFAGRISTPRSLRPCDVVHGADGEFVRDEDGVLVWGDVRVRISDASDHRREFKPRARWRMAMMVLAASFGIHATVLSVSRDIPIDLAEERASRRSLIAHLLSVHAGTEETPEEPANVLPHVPAHAERVWPLVTEEMRYGFIGILGRRSDATTSFGAPRQDGFRAGEWDDNATLREFRKVLAHSREPIESLDVSIRRVIVARDSEGKALPNCLVFATDASGATVTLRTLSNGRAMLFPRAEGLQGNRVDLAMRCGGDVATKTISLASNDDAVVTLDAREPRNMPNRTIDVGFALDTTGSMTEEIEAVKSAIRKAFVRESALRVGLVEYKDRGDEYTTRLFQMTDDLARFSDVISTMHADGGGDMPEAMNVGLHEALTSLAWNNDAAARLLFVIGDAPPHADDFEPRYADEAKRAAHNGIQIFTVAASGMDAFGQMVFRQIAQYTGGTEMFVLRGVGAGGGEPITSSGGTQTRYASANLDVLIVAKIEAARAAIDR